MGIGFRCTAGKLRLTLAFATATLVLAAAAAGSASAAPSSLLGLMQLPAPNTCLSNADPLSAGDVDCTPANGMRRATSVVVSPDGLNVYSAGGALLDSVGTASLAAFSRSTSPGPTEGALTQLPDPYDCISMDTPGALRPTMPAARR